MTKSFYSRDNAIQRAKPLFELSEVATEASCKRGKKPSIIVPAPAEPAIPFDSETILKAINFSPETRHGHSTSQIGLASFTLELAELHDLTTEATTDGRTKQGTERQTRSYSDKVIVPFTKDEEVNAGAASPLSAPPSRVSISLAPLKATPQTARKPFLSPTMHSSRVPQRYQLRHPDALIAEARERRRIADEIIQFEDQHRLKQEELSRIYKREKEMNVHRVLDPKVIRPRAVPKKTKPGDLPFTGDLVLRQLTQHEKECH